MKETIWALEQEINIMESNLARMEQLLKQMEEGIEGSENKKLLSEVAQRGDEVWLYDKLWYVIGIDDGIVKLISKDSAGAMTKNFREESDKFCCRLHKYSQEYVEKMGSDMNRLHTEVCSAQKEDLDKYLNREVNWGEDIFDSVWYTHYVYWLASPHPSYSGSVWGVSSNGGVYDGNGSTLGVRPVISLKTDVLTIGKDENNIWILYKEE